MPEITIQTYSLSTIIRTRKNKIQTQLQLTISGKFNPVQR